MFNQPTSVIEAGYLNKGSYCLSFRRDQIYEYERYDFGHTLLCYLSLTYMFHKPTPVTKAGYLNKGSCLARVLGVTKFMNMRDMILVTLCFATLV